MIYDRHRLYKAVEEDAIDASDLDELDRLRRLMALLATDVAASPTPRLPAFLTWAREHLAKREARLTGQEIENQFAAEHLFGVDDDHAFTLLRQY